MGSSGISARDCQEGSRSPSQSTLEPQITVGVSAVIQNTLEGISGTSLIFPLNVGGLSGVSRLYPGSRGRSANHTVPRDSLLDVASLNGDRIICLVDRDNTERVGHVMRQLVALGGAIIEVKVHRFPDTQFSARRTRLS